jgi:hypothetical protein
MNDTIINFEQLVIEQLKGYKGMVGRIKILEKHPIGNGMFLESNNDDDKLQDLHKKLKGLPSYMYLNGQEQSIEDVANAYMTEFPLGTRSQLNEVRGKKTVNPEDEKKLKQLKRKIEKVIDARRGDVEGFKGVVERLSEMQDLENTIQMIDDILGVLSEYKPHYTQLLRERFIEEKSVEEVTAILNVSKATFDRWKQKSVEEYIRLSGMRVN